MQREETATRSRWDDDTVSYSGPQLALFARVRSAPRWRRELGQLGRDIRMSWVRGEGNPDAELPDGPATLRWASDLAVDISLDEALALMPTQLRALGSFTEQSTRRFSGEIGRFAQRLQLEHVEFLRDVTAEHARRFIDEAVREGTAYAAPSIATRRFRRSAIRIAWTIYRGLHLVDGDPTLDIALPPRSDGPHTRPLEDDEEFLGRVWSRHTLVETRMPSVWALGQATATTGEIPNITIGDLTLSDSCVWIHGSNKREPRFGQLTDWGVEQLRRRIAQLDGDPDVRVVFDGALAGASGQASVSRGLYVVLARAGLNDDPGLRARSLPAWAGRHIHHDTGSIEQTARALGVRSLDQAARIIGYDWR